MLGRIRFAVCVAIVSASTAVVLTNDLSLQINLDLNIAGAVAIVLCILATLVGGALVFAAAMGLLFARRWASRLATRATLVAVAGALPLIVISGIIGSLSSQALVLCVLAVSAWMVAVLLARTDVGRRPVRPEPGSTV